MPVWLDHLLKRYYVTKGGKHVPKSRVKQFAIKILVDGKWKIPNPDEVDATIVSESPISEYEFEDVINELPGIKCVMIDQDGKIIGDYWRYINKDADSGILGDLKKTADTFSKISSQFHEIREGLMSLFPEIEQMKKMQPEQRDFFEELEEQRKRYEMLRDLFGGTYDRSRYPEWAMLLTDKEFRAGLRETASEFMKSLGESFRLGLEQGAAEAERIAEERQRVLSLNPPPEKKTPVSEAPKVKYVKEKEKEKEEEEEVKEVKKKKKPKKKSKKQKKKEVSQSE